MPRRYFEGEYGTKKKAQKAAEKAKGVYINDDETIFVPSGSVLQWEIEET